MGPAPFVSIEGVAPEKAPYRVIRRSFTSFSKESTKLLSSCLVWRFFRGNSACWVIVNGP